MHLDAPPAPRACSSACGCPPGGASSSRQPRARRSTRATGTIDLSGRDGPARFPRADHVECRPVRRGVTFAFAAAVAALCVSGSARRLGRQVALGRRRQGPDLEDRLPGAQRRPAGRVRRAPALLPAGSRAADPARDLAARARRHRAREREALGPAARRSAASAVVSPDGQGRLLANYSWGSAGQISDLARMPQIVQPHAAVGARRRAPRLRASAGAWAARRRCCCVARYPRLLAGAAAFDPVVDFTLQYREFPHLECSKSLPEAVERPGRAVAAGARARRARRLADAGPGRPTSCAARSPMPARSRSRTCRCRSGGARRTRS